VVARDWGGSLIRVGISVVRFRLKISFDVWHFLKDKRDKESHDFFPFIFL